MARAVGIGGVFLRARDPQGLAAWDAAHLGMGDDPVRVQAAGPAAFASSPLDSDCFPADRAVMPGFRVDDLDVLIAPLTDAGIAVVTRSVRDRPDVGRFACIHAPEGNPIKPRQLVAP